MSHPGGDPARVEEAFTALLGTPPDAREQLLDSLPPGVRTEVERLLRGHEALERSADPFLEALDPGRAGALLDAVAELPPSIGRYVVEGALGRGGHGLVYLARDPELGRQVAIKVLPPERTGRAEAYARLEAEARRLSALDHPHIATIHEIGRGASGELFLVMALHEGPTLRERLRAGPLPVTEALRLGAELADALAAAHARGIVHRDVKPENVLLTPHGVRLLDFGVAATADAIEQLPAGTIAYMSPEQRTGAAPDPRSDLWSLGVLLQEVLTGVRPGVDRVPAPGGRLPSNVPGRAARVIAACMAVDPARRPSSAGEVRDTLHAASMPRRRVELALGAGVAALLLATTFLSSRPPDSSAALPPGGTADPVAESLYTRGLAHLERRSPDDLEQAAILFRQAMARDSSFAGPYIGLTRVIHQSSFVRPGDRYARVQPLLARAMSLDSTNDEVALELGWIAMWYDRDLVAAERYLRRALALDPLNPWAYHYYTAWLSLLGRLEQAVELERRAMVVDPRGAATATHVALHLNRLGRHDEAIAILEELLTRDTTWARTHVVLGRTYLSVGRHEDALRHLRRENEEFAGFDPRAMLAYGLGLAGRRAEAMAITEEFMARARAGYTNPINLIACHLGLGDIAGALDWAERIPSDRGLMWFPRSDPMLEPLFDEPRFQRVLERVGLDSAAVSLLPDTWPAIEAILAPDGTAGTADQGS